MQRTSTAEGNVSHIPDLLKDRRFWAVTGLIALGGITLYYTGQAYAFDPNRPGFPDHTATPNVMPLAFVNTNGTLESMPTATKTPLPTFVSVIHNSEVSATAVPTPTSTQVPEILPTPKPVETKIIVPGTTMTLSDTDINKFLAEKTKHDPYKLEVEQSGDKILGKNGYYRGISMGAELIGARQVVLQQIDNVAKQAWCQRFSKIRNCGLMYELVYILKPSENMPQARAFRLYAMPHEFLHAYDIENINSPLITEPLKANLSNFKTAGNYGFLNIAGAGLAPNAPVSPDINPLDRSLVDAKILGEVMRFHNDKKYAEFLISNRINNHNMWDAPLFESFDPHVSVFVHEN